MKYREIWKVYSKVFDLTTLNVLEELKEDKFILEDLSIVSEGKEAVVCRSGDKAIKIYKIMNISYKRQIKYLEADPRIRSFPKTQVGVIYTWVKKEFKNLRKMFKSLISVPAPYVYKKNVLVMEFIGDEEPAPLLHEVIDKLEDKEKVFFDIVEEYRKIYHKARLVHGDFSEYNLLYYKGKIYVIDVSQSIPNYSPAASEYLEKDIENLLFIGNRLGVKLDKLELKRMLNIL
ncbi:MAG: hypothetical protein BXU00_01920 [Candidatus Nanoclepta minutus]|uniref:non-specific serine/threonine protein kinase n=1 Tax=Candidatus Nanoclepta minutus TaxID=1940235 RepID=A0A397WMJ6_9ARCH|nr:MAG: hypothetical protein BXU00_01920 [Candidatus Nanoclepta minutus]